jgi:hypothetical protein
MFLTTLIIATQAISATLFSLLAFALITGMAPSALARLRPRVGGR